MNITDTANELVVASGKRGKRQFRSGEGETQAIWNKIGSKMYCKTWGIWPIFYNTVTIFLSLITEAQTSIII